METAAISIIVLGLFTGLTSGGGVLPDGPLIGAIGGAVTFMTTLNPSEEPHISVTWKFRDKYIFTAEAKNITHPGYEDRITFFPSTYSLELRNLATSDSGEYRVTIVTPGEPVQHGNTQLELYVPVSNVRVTASSTNLLEQGSSVLTCTATGSSLFYKWLNGSSELTASDRVQITDGGSKLTLKGVLRYDQGPYSCYAFNSLNSGTSNLVNLTISYGPESTNLMVSPSQEHFENGSDITLSCSTDSRPEPRYEWLLNGRKLPDTGPELRLTNVQDSQSGNYSCQVVNAKTSKFESSQPWVVTVLEGISNSSVTLTTNLMTEGSLANLTCDAAGDIFTIEWTKDGSNLSLADNIIFYEENRVLSFQPLQKTDSGEYSCDVRNPVSNETARYIMVVNYGPENVEITGPSELYFGETFTLNCSAESEPSASYTWILNGTEIHDSPVYMKENAETSDFGNYTCQVVNNVTGRSLIAVHRLDLTEAGAGLSAGVIAGISVAVIVIVALAAAAAAGGFFIYKKRCGVDRKRKPPKPQTTSVEKTVQVEMQYDDNIYEEIDYESDYESI